MSYITGTLLNPGQIHTGAPAGNSRLDYAVCHFSLKAMADMAHEAHGRPEAEFTAALLKAPLTSKLLAHLFKP